MIRKMNTKELFAALEMLEKEKDFSILINLDLLTYAGNLENLKEIENDKRYKFIKGDICDRSLVENIFDK